MSWKEIALEKQLKFKESLGLTKSGTFGKKNKEYPNILHIDDAKKGANFYCYDSSSEWKTLKEWANNDKGSRVDFTNVGLTNMLRSEHITFNMFYPLEKLRTDDTQLLSSFINTLFDNKINVDEVTRIKIEFASDQHKTKLLDDNTSFDAYIEYMDGDKKCGLGIELKYTEKSYPYGTTEKKRMFDEPDSVYNTITKYSKYYNQEKTNELKGNKLKQLWRNHLLGIKMVEIKELNKFTSVHLYPEGNTYQQEACEMYSTCLANNKKDSFVPITFEKFIAVANDIFSSKEHKAWIEYLSNRY